jgi:hypothetical protein
MEQDDRSFAGDGAWAFLSPRWAWLTMLAASALACAASFARQGYLLAVGGPSYCAVLTLFAFVPCLLAWLVASMLAVGEKPLRAIIGGREAAPPRARVATVAAAVLCAFLGTGLSDQYASFPIKSMEGRTRGLLSMLRSSLSLYYGDAEGRYPAALSALAAGGKYVTEIPAAATVPHGKTNAVSLVDTKAFLSGKLPDTGGWAYVVSGSSVGALAVDCTHTDSHGSAWNTY